MPRPSYPSDIAPCRRPLGKDIPAWIVRVGSTWRANAKARGIAWHLSSEDLRTLAERSGGRCEVTGVPFCDERIGARRRRPFIPSLDRIDSKGAYEIGNCRLVTSAVNLMMSEWGEEVVIRHFRSPHKPVRGHSIQLKRDTLELAAAIGSLSEAARRFGVPVNTVTQWASRQRKKIAAKAANGERYGQLILE